jgi:hypothetical protein
LAAAGAGAFGSGVMKAQSGPGACAAEAESGSAKAASNTENRFMAELSPVVERTWQGALSHRTREAQFLGLTPASRARAVPGMERPFVMCGSVGMEALKAAPADGRRQNLKLKPAT